MVSSVAAAFIGTELAAWGQFWLSVEYAGSFIALMLANIIAIGILAFIDPVLRQKKYQPPHQMRLGGQY